MNAIRSWEADFARRLGIGGLIDFDKTAVGKTLHIPCAVGKHMVDFKVRPNLDPNGSIKEMIHKGWTVGRNRLVCPDCKRKSEQDKADKRREHLLNGSALSDEGTAIPPLESLAPPEPPKKRGVPPPENLIKARASVTTEQRREWGRRGGFVKQQNKLKREGRIPAAPLPELRKEEPIMASATPPSATDKARAAKRETMDLLTLAFKLAPDGKSGQYQDGYSDARIAKESGLSEQAVATLREDFYGPLGMPDELGIIRAELAHCKRTGAEKFAAHEAEIARIERRFNALCDKQGWTTI